MLCNSKRWLGALLVVGSMLTATSALAQDFPTLKGNNQRQGRNSDPLTSFPGQGRLTWFRPNLQDGALPGSVIRNNNAAPPNIQFTAGWVAAPTTGQAQFVFDLGSTGSPAVDAIIGTGGNPPYYYANTVASGNNPTVAAVPGTLASFAWTLDPRLAPTNAPNGEARNYAVYAWIPTGPTVTPLGARFPQRYYVFRVTWGPAPSQTFVDVVDTYTAGIGFVRLGNGGLSTNRMFTFDGTNPIVVELYNTVPRDPNSGLLLDLPGETLVYADAALAVPASGSYTASPTVSAIPSGLGTETRAVGALNEESIRIRNGVSSTVVRGVVTSYQHNTGQVRWRFSPADDTRNVEQDQEGAGVTTSGAWVPFTDPGPSPAVQRGTSYLVNDDVANPLTTAAGGTAAVTFDPNLPDGTYDVQIYVSGDTGGQSFSRSLVVEINEGATTTQFEIDQSIGPRWVRIGNRSFTHNNAGGEPLSVVITNQTNDPAEVGSGRLAYADSVRFVDVIDAGITSTPVTAVVNVNIGGVSTPRPVVVVPAEDGRIYCLDAEGNADGTTNVYWTYPSLPRPNDPSWSDPNNDSASSPDGSNDTTLAEMPTGFGFSSAAVVNLGSALTPDWRLYIGSRNGRVYCIDMDGRGDQDVARGYPGTTERLWSFPSDYPSVRRRSALGPFEGSVAFEVTADGPTIFAPTTQGRLYALDAAGNPNRTTDTRWTFPGLNQPTIGEITTTPAVEFGQVYFGTAPNGADPGRFYAVDMDPPSPAPTATWVFQGTASSGTTEAFIGGPATAPAALLGGAMPDTVFVANNNLFVYALNAATGAAIWETRELNSTVTGSLLFTPMNVFDNTGAIGLGAEPLIMVPTDIGNFAGLFARSGTVNRFGTRRAWQYNAADGVVASMASGQGFMYGADLSGNYYAFSNTSLLGGQGNPPGEEVIVENDASGDPYRNAKIRLLTQEGYERLRLEPTDPGALDYNTVINDVTGTYSFDLNPMSFEWGQTARLIVYDFPYAVQTPNGSTVPPPVVTFQISVEGASNREYRVSARQWRIVSGTNPPAGQDGYAILQFPIQGSGPNSVPPGSGRVQVSISTRALNNDQRPRTIALDPALSSRDFFVANPLAISMTNTAIRSFGHTVNPADFQARANGVVDDPTTAGVNEALIATTVGAVGHGQSGLTSINVFDRSMLTLLRGPGRGLDNVRVERSELEWMNGSAAIFKPLDPTLYPNFEDRPDQFPNISFDYPNVRREQIAVTKDPNGTAENPVFSPVSLTPPNGVTDNPLTRTLVGTRFDLQVEVPRFQPPNLSGGFTTVPGVDLPGGYNGRINVFVDSDGDGLLDATRRRVEANRWFTLTTAVTVDQRVEVRTPSVDLGSLPGGAGYSPAPPASGASSFFNPWGFPVAGVASTGAPDFIEMFKPFQVENPGNVNLLNVRMAKFTNVGNAYESWKIFSNSVDDLGWIDGGVDMWSDLDEAFALRNPTNPLNNSPIVPKPRVGDRSGSVLKTNAERRDNTNLGVTQSRLIPGLVADNPRVAVTIPLGFPVGTYSQLLRVIEDYDYRNPASAFNGDESLNLDSGFNPIEAFSDPTLNVIFKVRESRLTNGFTTYTRPMADDPAVLGAGPNFQHSNLQPAAIRDADGNLIIAYASNRPSQTAAQPTSASANDQWRIYFSSLDGTVPLPGAPARKPLNDLNSFVRNSNTQWFAGNSPGGFPATGSFPVAAGETLIAGTERYGSPSFPGAGFANPYAAGGFSQVEMAFIGEAQKTTGAGRISNSLIFGSVMTTSASGVPTLSAPFVLTADPQVQKGRPTILKVSNEQSLVFYTAYRGGQSEIFWTALNASGFTDPRRFDVGNGFESVASPSATGRAYTGANGAQNIVEVLFTGKLRGRAVSEVYLGRNSLTGSGTLGNSLWMSQRTQEILTPDGDGVFRAQGVIWNRSFQPQVWVSVNGGLPVNIETGNRIVDRDSGLITFDTRLGGKAYLDPNTGTVRLSSGGVARGSTLMLTYQPRFLRVSEGTTAGYVGSHMLWDNRYVGSREYWYDAGGSPAPNGDPISARYFMTYNRAAAGSGQAARPFMRTMRIGIQLPTQIYTAPDGSFNLPGGGGSSIQVSGTTGYFQVDPARGRIYVSPEDEDRVITVNWVSIDAQGNPVYNGAAPNRFQAQSAAVPIVETREQPIPIEQAVNESNLTPMLDPFNSAGNDRPGLIWMFWSSTRAGGPDVFFQSMAPRFAPLVAGR